MSSELRIAAFVSGMFVTSVLGCARPAPPPMSSAPRSAQTEDDSNAAGDGARVAQPPQGTPRAAPDEQARLCAGLVDSPDSARCQSLAAVDRALSEGQTAGVEQRLLDLAEGDDLATQARAPLPQPLTELESIQRFVLARALLLRASLSYGAGDENSALAARSFDDLATAGVHERLSARLTLERSRARLAQGLGDEALRLIGPLAEQLRDDAEVQATLGIALLATGAVKRSLVPLQRSLELDPDEPERHLVLGTARMLDGDLNAAERNFRGGLAAAARVEREPAHKVELLARAYGDLGAVLLVKGDAEGGRAYLTRALGLMPNKATYLANLSYSELLLGDAREAETAARKALAVDEQFVSGWLNLGLAQAQLGQFDAAQISFETAQRLDPSDPRPQANLLDLKELRSVRGAEHDGGED